MKHLGMSSCIRRRLVVGALITLILPGLFFTIRQNRIQAYLADYPQTFYTSSAYQTDLLLDNFPVYRQSYANSCGPTTISMIYSYLVQPISEQEMAAKLGFSLGKSGMLPDQFYQRLRSALGEFGYRVDHRANIPDAAFLEQTYVQLEQGIPVPIYFSTVNDWNKPYYDTHYSLIIGMRPKKREVVIANAYGFMEEMSISDLLSAMKYKNFSNAPIDFRFGLFVGVINKNNLFIIQK